MQNSSYFLVLQRSWALILCLPGSKVVALTSGPTHLPLESLYLLELLTEQSSVGTLGRIPGIFTRLGWGGGISMWN